MMKTLMSKDVLSEPMGTLKKMYPPWLAENADTLSADEADRYKRQYKIVCKICASFDANEDDYEKVVRLMTEMQDSGQPPPAIVKAISPGVEMGADGNPMMPDMGALTQGCAQQ